MRKLYYVIIPQIRRIQLQSSLKLFNSIYWSIICWKMIKTTIRSMTVSLKQPRIKKFSSQSLPGMEEHACSRTRMFGVFARKLFSSVLFCSCSVRISFPVFCSVRVRSEFFSRCSVLFVFGLHMVNPCSVLFVFAWLGLAWL